MSDHGTAVPALDAAIDMLITVRTEVQARHDETVAAIGVETARRSRHSTFIRLFRQW